MCQLRGYSVLILFIVFIEFINQTRRRLIYYTQGPENVLKKLILHAERMWEPQQDARMLIQHFCQPKYLANMLLKFVSP